MIYIREKGSIAPQRIYDRLFDNLDFVSAKICWTIAAANGNKNVKIQDFMSKKDEVEEEVATPVSVFNLLKACAKA